MQKVVISTIDDLKEVLGEVLEQRLTAWHQKHEKYGLGKKEEQPEQAGAAFLNKRQAARLLSCSPSTIDNHARAGSLTRHYVGKAVRFDRQEVLNLAKRHTSTKQRI